MKKSIRYISTLFLAVSFFATACEDPFKPQMAPPSNPLMGYKWENVQERVIDGENTTYTITLYFETDSTGKRSRKFEAPGHESQKVIDFVYTFEGDSGTLAILNDFGHWDTDKITYDRTKHELYWWKWRTYDGRRDSAMVLTRYNL